jgi:WD40 repeat protein
MSDKTRQEIELIAEALDDVEPTAEEIASAVAELPVTPAAWAAQVRARVVAAQEAARQAKLRALRSDYVHEHQRYQVRNAEPVRARQQLKPPPSSRTAPKHVILFLAANPRDTGRLALDREARSIHVELRRSGYRDRFDFVTRWAAEPLDLLRELRELRPTIVHFSGHGARPTSIAALGQARDLAAPPEREPAGVVFDSASGRSHVVSPEAIAQTLGAVGAKVRLVLLNACYTGAIADALLAHVDCVIGMTGAIHDDAARSFAIGFYGGLGEHESIAAAFEQGKAAICLDGLPDADQPQIQTRDGADAAQLILAAVSPSALVDVPCPYPGMRPFAADDAGSFHGREAEIMELIGRLRAGQREIFVIGPSGSGKSSLVAAGVLPRLARGLSGLGPFVVRELRPGDQPLLRLCQALDAPPGQPLAAAERVASLLAQRAPGASALIVVDQLEELFTQASAEERARFLDALGDLRTERRCAVIFTLRADFSGAFMESPLWPVRPAQISRVEVTPLRGKALRDAIAAPAERVGVTVEPELIERLVADAASEPGILPLLQETLVQLWDARADQTLTQADYQALGDGVRSGLAVALARRADAILQRFTAAQVDIARRILLRLVSFGEGRSDTRRQQPRTQLCTAGEVAADSALVLQTMADDRLLTVDDDVAGEPMVDLAHEVMIAAWPTLAGWIRSHRFDEQKRRQLEAAAVQWVEYGRGVRGLLDLIELADAEQWQHTESARDLGHSTDVMALIAASRAEHAKRENEARKQAEKLAESECASRRLLAQMYMESGRQLLLDGHPQEAFPYFVAARRNGLDEPPLRMLFAAAKRHLPSIPALLHQGPVWNAAFSPDGTRVVTASNDKTARVWDVTTGKPLTSPLEHQDLVVSAVFSPDGTRVVTASHDKTARVWDAATGKPLTSALEHKGQVWSAAFTPDGTRVVTASEDRTAQVWDAATGKPLTSPLKHTGQVKSVAFTPDGIRVVTASEDRTAQVWDVATGKPLTSPLGHQHEVLSAAFSPDGTRVVTASHDKTARVWDAATGKPLTSPLEHQHSVLRAAFSPDGRRVVTASYDKTARVWDVATGKPLTSPLEHQDQVVRAAFSPDGASVVTASADKTARVWDAVTGKPLTSPLEHQGPVVRAAFSPDGTRVVTASHDKTARVWDAATGKPLISPLEHLAEVARAAFSPDGTRVVTASLDKTARVWDAATGKPLTNPLTHRGPVRGAAFSPEGARVVTASDDSTARVWDAATGKPLTSPLEHQGWVWTAAFSPDGTRVVTAVYNKTARVWDAATGKPLTSPLKHQDVVVCAAFSPDGARVVTASHDKTARVWDAATGKPLTSPLEHQGWVGSAAFSPDGTRVVTASEDRTAQVWDVATGKPLTSPLEHQHEVLSAAFSPDGTRVVTASHDNTARVWDAATGKPLTNPLEHQGPVWSAAFSSDGTRVVTASVDRTARVWDAATGKPLTCPLEHQGQVASAAFSPDGTRVVTASWDKTARVWNVQPDTGTLEEWAAIAERSPFVLEGIALVPRSTAASAVEA